MTGQTITAVELARRLRRNVAYAEAVLEAMREDGLAEESDDGGWRLTEGAEAEFGPVVRALERDAEKRRAA